jgi:sugar phosphate isomerase/epimerase
MKLAFSTLGCPRWDFSDIFSTAKDLGYDAVEVRGINRELYAPKMAEFSNDLEKTRSWLKSLGIEISMLTSSATLAVRGAEDAALAEAKDYIDLAKKLDVKYVRIMSTGNPQYDGGDIDQCKRLYSEIVKYADKTGVTPLLETNGLFVDTKVLGKLLDEVGGGGALWDIHHPYRFGGESMEQTVENLGAKIKYVHVKDSVVERGATAYKMTGYGDIPIAAAINALKKISYDGYLSLEWVKRWNMELEEPGIVFAHYLTYMKQILA